MIVTKTEDHIDLECSPDEVDMISMALSMTIDAMRKSGSDGVNILHEIWMQITEAGGQG